MVQRSAGILLYRAGPEFLLLHPGGPFWARKDEGAWTIPKVLVEPGEDTEVAARREFVEETGAEPPATLLALGEFRQPSGKVIVAYAAEGAFEPTALRSSTFELEWPRNSGRTITVPEADRAAWFARDEALRRILRGQAPIVAALLDHLNRPA